MLFNSLHFLVFFPVVTLLYFGLPYKCRWILLLVASCYFYMALVPAYILVLFFLIGVDYTAGLLIETAQGPSRKAYLVASLVANLGVLAFFKYWNFFNTSVFDALGFFGWQWPVPLLRIVLPIGLSFHTFQSISYTIEVYRGAQRAERHLGFYALYVLFYPQLVAGPIERPQNLLHQLHESHDFDYQRVTDGLKLMVWGLFKKVVIADRLAVAVNLVYDNPTSYVGLPLIISTYYFAIQIYCDFSGYTDIARGAAQVMGIQLMQNFNSPYHADTIAEFWRRWHISLSTWFRDYLYIPLGGNRVSTWRWYGNLMIVFAVSGLWHGANWTFLLWGLLHGFYLVFSLWTHKWRFHLAESTGWNRLGWFAKCVRVAVTFHLVCFAWVFFRASSLSDAWYILRHMFVVEGGSLLPRGAFVLPREELVIPFAAIAVMEMVHWIQRRQDPREFLSRQPAWLRWSVYYVVFYATVFFGHAGSQQFVYFQF